MPDRLLALMLRRHNWVAYALAFAVIFVQPAWGYSTEVAGSSEYLLTSGDWAAHGSLSEPVLVNYSALPSWFRATNAAVPSDASTAVRVASAPRSTQPDRFTSVAQPRPLFQESPSLSKEALNPTPTLGEIYTYTLVFTIPSGDFSAVKLSDRLPRQNPRLNVISGSATDPVPVSGPPLSALKSYSSYTLTWDLGDISGPGGVYAVAYRAEVDWNPVRPRSDRGDVGVNNAELSWSGGSVSATVPITVVAPAVRVKRIGYSSEGERAESGTLDEALRNLRSGEIVTLTVVVTNAVEAWVSPAYSVTVQDHLPPWINYVDTIVGPDPVTRPGGIFEPGTELEWKAVGAGGNVDALDVLEVGEVFSVTYRAMVVTGVAPGHIASRNATAEYFFQRHGPDKKESSPARIEFSSPLIRVVKSVQDKPLIPPQAAGVVAGEIVTYTVVYTFPRGTTVYTPTYLVDRMDDGLRFSGVASQPGELGPPSVDTSGEDYAVLRWDIDAPQSFDTDLRHTFVITAQVSPTRFLGSDSGQPVPQGEQLDNQAVLNWLYENEVPTDSDDPRDDADIATVWLIRPDIQPAKWKESPLREFEGPGIPVRFELREILNISDTYGAVAYSVIVTDALPFGWTFDNADPPPDSYTTINGQETVTWGPFTSLPMNYYLPGPSLAPSVFVITATPPLTVIVGAPYTNTVEVGYVSAEGYGYRDRDALRMTLLPTVTKQVRPPALDFRVGEVITYSLVGIVQPGAASYWPRHIDTLPRGVHYIAGSHQVTGGMLYNGPVTGTNIDGHEVITWWWNTLDNTAGFDPLTFIFTFEVALTGEDTNGERAWTGYGSAVGFTNRSLLQWNTENVSDTYEVEKPADAGSRVIQPYLLERDPDKEVVAGGPTVEGGDVLTYSFTVYNTGYAPAYEVVVSDTLPPGLAFRSFEARVYPATAVGRPPYEPTAIQAPGPGQQGTIGWVFDEVAAGDGNTTGSTTQLVITYSVDVADSVGAGAPLTNSAWISDYTSLPGSQPYERHYGYLGGAGDQAGPISVREAQITKSTPDAEVLLGELVVFTIRVPDPPLGAMMYNVVVTDTMPTPPPGPLQVLDVVAPGNTSLNFTNNSLEATYDSIPARSQATIVVTARVPITAVGGVVLNDAAVAWDDAASDGNRHSAASDPVGVTIVTPEIGVTKDAPNAVSPGFPLVYTIRYDNRGLATAADVRLTDTLPISVTLVSVDSDRPVTQTGFMPGPLVWDLGDLSSGESGTIWLTLTVWSTATLGDRLVNTVSISTPSLGDDPADNQDATVTVVSAAVLEVTKTAAPETVLAGGQILYTLVVTNSGGEMTQNLLVTDRVPSNTSFVGASPGGSLVGNVVTWSPTDIGTNEHRVVTFAVEVQSTVLSGTLIINDAYGAVADNAPGPSVAPVVVTVRGVPILFIEKSAPETVSSDEDLVYTIRYGNTGNAVAHSTRIVETYDPNVTFVDAVPLPDVADNVWQFDTLAPGSDNTILVTVHVGASVDDGILLTNTVSIDSDETEPQSDTVSTLVGEFSVLYLPLLMKDFTTPPAPVGVNLVVQSIEVDPDSPAVGQSTRITVTLQNLGQNAVSEDFWVDLYIDPTQTPTVNVLWNDIAPYGKAWFVHDDIPGGGTLVIHTDQPDDPQDPDANYSNWPGWFVSAGEHVLYAQVDSYGMDWGLVLEDDETDNVTGPWTVTVVPGSGLMAPSPPIQWQERR